jgi:hypothetical protein
MAAALAAARSGAPVWLVEAGADIGGTVANSLIHTLGGLYDSSGNFINDGLARELAERLERASPLIGPRRIGKAWTLCVCPEVYQEVVRRWIAEEPRITLALNARVQHLAIENDRVSEMHLAAPAGPIELRPRAVIDSTRTADIVRVIDPALVHDDRQRAAGGLIFRMRGVEPGTLVFPRGLQVLRAVHQAARDGSLPASCAKVWFDSGVHPDEVYVKLWVPLADDWRERERRGEISGQAHSTQRDLVAFLARLPGFAQARVTRTGKLGVRDGGRIKGAYYLTEEDVRTGRKFPDAACRCAWPIEYWDPEQGVTVEYLADDCHYQ